MTFVPTLSNSLMSHGGNDKHDPTIQTYIPEVAATLKGNRGKAGGCSVDVEQTHVVAPALVKRYGKGTDSDATDALITTGFHQTQDPISGEEFSPALGVTSHGMGVAFTVNQRAGGTHQTTYLAPTAAAVRRLTPTECERLQGFPDGWTQIGGSADSKRYAALGDAVTVNVGRWLGERLDTVR